MLGSQVVQITAGEAGGEEQSQRMRPDGLGVRNGSGEQSLGHCEAAPISGRIFDEVRAAGENVGTAHRPSVTTIIANEESDHRGHSRGSTGSLSRASTPKTHSCTR